MILATIFTFIVERSSKNMYFHPTFAWPPATYDVISRNQSNWPSLNLTQNLREGWTNNYWKRQELMFYPQGKNSEKPCGGGGGGASNVHPMCDAPLSSRSARRSFALSQKFHRNHRSCMWTEVQSDVISMIDVIRGSAKAIRYSVNIALTLQSNLQYGWIKWKICCFEPWRGWRMLFSGRLFAH